MKINDLHLNMHARNINANIANRTKNEMGQTNRFRNGFLFLLFSVDSINERC